MNVFFHVGHHKTGTTWLQKGLYVQHQDIHLVNRPSAPWDSKLLQQLIGASERSFDVAVARSTLHQSYDVKKKVQLVSAERLSGHPLSGGFDSYIIAERIKKICPQAKIVIGVRHQFSMLRSLYIQMLKEGFIGSFNDFVNSSSWKRPFFRQDYLEYHFLVSRYIELFGKQNVLVKLYEDLSDSPKDWLIELCSFMGIDYIRPDNLDKKTNQSPVDRVIELLHKNYTRKSEYNLHPLPNDTDDSFIESLVAQIKPFDYDTNKLVEAGLRLDAFCQSNSLMFESLGLKNAYYSLDKRLLGMVE
jgi:hypothetical protein